MSPEELMDQVSYKITNLEAYKMKPRFLVMNEDDAIEAIDNMVKATKEKHIVGKEAVQTRNTHFMGLMLRSTTAFPRGYVSVRESHLSNNPLYHLEV